MHTVAWEWAFETTTNDEVGPAQDVTDTTMGNAEKLAEVKLVISVTATQID